MAYQTTVTLDDRSGEIIHDKLETGEYRTVADVVRAGLTLLAAHDEKVEALRAALVEGERSGAPEPFDFDAFISRKKQGDAAAG